MKLMLALHLFNNNSLTKFHENLTHGLAADNGLESNTWAGVISAQGCGYTGRVA
jgi:hypothetical protein